MKRPHVRSLWVGLLLISLGAAASHAQVPAPADMFGFEPGADYELVSYDQMVDYFEQLDAASDRVTMKQIGASTMGRPMYLLFISSAENLRRLDRWRAISEQLARARLPEEKARELARQGKAVVWIDAGMHATERATAQMSPALAHRMATEESAEMQKIRDEVVTLLMPVLNPDGLDIVANWYDRVLGTPHETTSPPWLYQKYVGHDNNRDWFMNNMKETRAATKVLYRQWYPQIVYNHHQAAPDWARIFVPPFSDPVNQHIHPAVVAGVNQVGTAMASRFAIKRMPGVVSEVSYTMFWNGGMRTTPYFHNQIGILTETAHTTPTPRFYEPDDKPDRIAGRTTPTDKTDIFYPYPWEGGESHLRDAVDYMITASMATLDLAADRRGEFLYNMYSMGRDAIEAGQSGDPYAYVIPAEQWDEGEAVNLVDVLRRGGVEVHRAEEAFTVGDTDYEAGAFVAFAGQAFRPYLMDLLEKQNYPTRYQYPGGPPDPPYDLAGWTLPMQMGVQVDRINEPFDVETAEVEDLAAVEPGQVTGGADFGYLLSHRPNASVKAVNRLSRRGAQIYWTRSPVEARGRRFAPGTFVVEADGGTGEEVHRLARELGLDFTGVSRRPAVEMQAIERPHVALYKSWQANMDEGWTRWLLNSYDIPVDTLHDADIRERDLGQYDAVVLPDQHPGSILNGHRPGTMPDAFVGGMGVEGAHALKQYVEDGGTLITFDSASDFAIQQFGLPVRNVVSGTSTREFFIPGSLIRMDVDTEHPLAYGMQPEAAASFSRSRAFEKRRPSRTGEGGREDIEEAPPLPVDVVTEYAEEDLLMSGWAMGEKEYLSDKAAMMNVGLGEGNVVLFGFRPQFRGQPRGTYKLLFNALLAATLEDGLQPETAE